MNKSQKNIAYLIIGICIIALLGHQLMWWTIPNLGRFQAGGTTGGGQTIDTTMRDNYLKGIGVFQCNTKAYNSLVAATAYTIATHCNVYYYHFLGGQWILGVTASAGTDLFDAKVEDNGYMWVVVVPTTWKFYIDYQKTMTNNGYIVSYQYVDVDGDGVRNFAFQCDLRNHAIPSSGYPVISFTSYLLAYNVPAFGCGYGANSTGIGAATKNMFYNWYLTGIQNNGTGIYRIELIAGNATVPCTDLTTVSLKKLEIPTLGYLDGSQFTQTFTTQDIRWTYTATSNFDHAIYAKVPPNANTQIDMKGQLEFTLGATTEVAITMNLYYLVAPGGSGASISCTFYATLA